MLVVHLGVKSLISDDSYTSQGTGAKSESYFSMNNDLILVCLRYTMHVDR